MNFTETVTSGGVVAIIGLATVFAVLMILWGVLELMRVIFTPKENKAEKSETASEAAAAPVAVPVAEEATDESELVAVLTAAIAASLNTSTYNLNIKSYRQVPSSTPMWNRVSRRENLR